MTKKSERIIRNIIRVFGVAICAAYIFFTYTEAKSDSVYYTVEFRAGEHGSIQGGEKAVISAGYGEQLLLIPEPDSVENGYWFTGYSPDVKNTVTENAVYVAQYARLTDAVEYRVNYIDSAGASIATQRIAYANEGEIITAYAVDISGYTADEQYKQVKAEKSGTDITFVYLSGENTADNDEENVEIVENSEKVITTERVVSNENAGNQVNTFNRNVNAAENTADNPQNGQLNQINNTENQNNINDTGLNENKNITDKDADKAENSNDKSALETEEARTEEVQKREDKETSVENKSDKSKIPVWVYAAGVAALGIITAAANIIIRKKFNADRNN